MTKLNVILAVEKSARSEGETALTNAYQVAQKAPLLSGISRNYQPKDDDGDTLPAEFENVNIKVEDLLDKVSSQMERLFDITFTKDSGNRQASADVIVEGQTLLTDVPATHLLWLEKKLVDLRTFISKLPVLDPSVRWSESETLENGVWESDPVQTTRTKKVPRNWVKAEATDKHPAQVEVYHEDVIVGYWTTTKFSGAIPAERRATLLHRVGLLSDAVKVSRERANATDVTDRKSGSAIFGYLFA